MPPAHVPVAQAVLAGVSLLSTCMTTLPAPSHTLTLQSPAVWPATTTPEAVKVEPHTPALQVKVLQSVEVPQSLATEQPDVYWVTHLPLLQT